MSLEKFIKNSPKAELHLHIEGTLEPELMFSLAKRNNVEIPYKNIVDVNESDFENQVFELGYLNNLTSDS